MINSEQLKQEVAEYWTEQACGTELTTLEKFSADYFRDIEQKKYKLLPEIHSFAQFTRYRGQTVLEVGIGIGIDFLQWVRAGARAYGVDLTQEAVDHATHLLALNQLRAEEIRVADAESLPFADNTFDLVYSNGVIHHTPDTFKALAEIIRVTRPGGTIKVVIYNRHSVCAFLTYLRYGFFKGKPFRSFADAIYYHMESIGTKAYTAREVRQVLADYPVSITQLYAPASFYDLIPDHRSRLLHAVAYVLACLWGFNRSGWLMNIEAIKFNTADASQENGHS